MSVVKVSTPRDENFYIQQVAYHLVEREIHQDDLMGLATAVDGHCVYVQKQVRTKNMRGTVSEIKNGLGKPSISGYISQQTKLLFRTKNIKLRLLIQYILGLAYLRMSKEMWDYGTNGYTFGEQIMYGLLLDLVEKWKDHHSNIDLRVTLFSRTFNKTTRM